MYQRAGDTDTRVWKLLAFVGRYGHQPVDVAMRLTARQLVKLADCVAELVKEENEGASTASD